MYIYVQPPKKVLAVMSLIVADVESTPVVASFRQWLCSETAFQFRTASLPGGAGMRFRCLKRVDMHETTYLHTNNQKIAKYFKKSATRTFGESCTFRTSVHAVRTRRAFHHIRARNLCRDVEEYPWSVLMQFAFLKRALVARKLRNTREFSGR